MSDPVVYLASASPRRHELLAQIGVRHEVLAVDVAEQWDGVQSARHYVERLALAKALAGLAKTDRSLPVIGADTAVVIDDDILGKPKDREQAVAMLMRLSGRCHSVYSAVAIVGAIEAVQTSISRVCFRTISAAEANAYWETGEPADKAGAYGIQGQAALFIARLEGSFSGVMGLPLYETAQLLKAAGISLALASRPDKQVKNDGR